MAQDFMSAVRTSSVNRLANIKDRQARLRGRPLTQAEQAAPYAALAETASSRLAQGKTLDLQEQQQDTQKEQFGEELSFRRESEAQDAALERERLAALREQNEASLKLQREQMDAQMAAAAQAREASERAQTMQMATVGAGLGMIAIKEWGGSIASGIGDFLGCLIVSACCSRDSYEVGVTRAFRDYYLDTYSLLGYYAFAPFIAALEDRWEWFRRLVKACLVNHLIDYGEWVLGLKSKRERRGSKTISRAFLWGIRTLGKRIGV